MKPNQLCREDFQGDPVSLDEITNGLWLGNLSAATDVDTLTSNGITHILTVDTCPLPDHILQIESITNSFVQLIDAAKADLLGVLEGCVEFITSALKDERNKVLVHCFFGVSRSAAVVIAFLMHRNRLDYNDAFEIVKSKRPTIGPNAGFVQQLRLYQHMNYSVDEEHQLYKVYRLRLASVDIQKHLFDPADYAHLIRPDPALADQPTGAKHFRCRKCSRTLATDANHLPHSRHSTDADNPSSAYDEHNGILADIFPVVRGIVGADRRLAAVAKRACTDSIFVEPLAWMQNVCEEREGKLHCPKCQTKVGSFDWANAGHCPCGVLVAPSFYLVPSKVELRTAKRN